jgi:hypothetical protein
VFRKMVNESLRIGIAYDASSLRKLSLLSYQQLAQFDSPSYYKLLRDISGRRNTGG